MPPPPPQKIATRACDACKIRKIRCSSGNTQQRTSAAPPSLANGMNLTPPCKGCRDAGIACTFVRDPRTRGPRRLRGATLREIAETQRRCGWKGSAMAEGALDAVGKEKEKEIGGTPTHTPVMGESGGKPFIPSAALVFHLCIYTLRLSPVWPILDTSATLLALQRLPPAPTTTEDLETYALATALAAATTAQLALSPSSCGNPSGIALSGEDFETECQRARGLFDWRGRTNLVGLRTSFFLHVYWENVSPAGGGGKSWGYLREAIAMCQLLGLERGGRGGETEGGGGEEVEVELRRRIVWLLFVTERGMSILHNLPVVLKPTIPLPTVVAAPSSGDGGDAEDEARVLPAFLNLVQLFSTFGQAGMFEILLESPVVSPADSSEFRNQSSHQPSSPITDGKRAMLQELQRKLLSLNPLARMPHATDIQKADLLVTQHWMLALLWKLTTNSGRLLPAHLNPDPNDEPESSSSSSSSSSASSCPASRAQNNPSPLLLPSFPIHATRHLLHTISPLPTSALEAHGTGIELKLHTICHAVADGMESIARDEAMYRLTADVRRPSEVLLRLWGVLKGVRGGNVGLVEGVGRRVGGVVFSVGRVPRGVGVRAGGKGGGRLQRRRGWEGDRGVVGEWEREGEVGSPVEAVEARGFAVANEEEVEEVRRSEMEQSAVAGLSPGLGGAALSPGFRAQLQRVTDFSWLLNDDGASIPGFSPLPGDISVGNMDEESGARFSSSSSSGNAFMINPEAAMADEIMSLPEDEEREDEGGARMTRMMMSIMAGDEERESLLGGGLFDGEGEEFMR